ncbi:MAG: hypothetical protein ACKV22_18735 [Bryobacteraceae bacterium]
MIKASGFRVVHVDGAHGGLTPHGQIFAVVYSERPAIPQIVVHPLESSGTLGEEITAERITKGGIVRELEVGLTMNLAVAEGIHKWLGNKISELKVLTSDGKREANDSGTVQGNPQTTE